MIVHRWSRSLHSWPGEALPNYLVAANGETACQVIIPLSFQIVKFSLQRERKIFGRERKLLFYVSFGEEGEEV